LEGVLFVLGLRVSLLSMLALEDVGYVILFRRQHVLIYRTREDPIPLLVGERVGRLYFVLGQPIVAGPGGWMPVSELDEE